MAAPPPKSEAAPRDRGFVLIGVVMFVLALTILGLSLFSLSGYEASFLAQSRDGAQAFYDATGGLDRARYMLVTRNTLQSVQDTLFYDGPEGVIYTRACYSDDHADTSGTVNWNSPRTIDIRVLAVRHGIRRMIECTYQPHPLDDYYKRLLTSTGDLEFSTETSLISPPGNRYVDHRGTAYLTGEAWLNNPSTGTWFAPPSPSVGQPPTLVSLGAVPQPAIDDFLAAHFNEPSTYTVPADDGGGVVGVDYKTYDLSLGLSNQVTFYRTAAVSGRNESLKQFGLEPSVNVRGYAVWMLDKGIHVRYGLTVNGSSQDCLIIIAKKWTYPTGNEAMWFYGGIESPVVPVILISAGDVGIEQEQFGAGNSTQISYLSIFSGGNRIKLSGPVTGFRMDLIHQVGAVQDQPGKLIDNLYNQGALPNPPSGQLDHLTRVAGTWREVTESVPD